MTQYNLQPRHVAIIETLKQCLEQGKLQEKSVVETTDYTGKRRVLGTFIFWEHVHPTCVRELDNMKVTLADLQTLANAGFLFHHPRGYKVNAKKIREFMP
jgi:hypothetical protein